MTKRGPKTNNKPKMGRPNANVDWSLLPKLCKYPLTNEDIAAIMDTSIDTVSRYVKKHYDCTFAEYKQQKQSNLRLTILQKQIEVAKNGNVSMLIWLGKQYLGQSEKVENKNSEELKITIEKTDEGL